MSADRLTDMVAAVVADALADPRLLEAVLEIADRPLAVDVREAARLIGCSSDQVRKMLDVGMLSRVPGMGTRILIPRASIEALVAGERGRRLAVSA